MAKFVLLSLEYSRVPYALRLYPLNAILATLEPPPRHTSARCRCGRCL